MAKKQGIVFEVHFVTCTISLFLNFLAAVE